MVVIGSGITACSFVTELLEGQGDCHESPNITSGLQRDSLSVTVLEARGICSGATGRNGGHIKCNPVFDYQSLHGQVGERAALKIIRFCMSHFAMIRAAAERLGLSELGEVREVTAITSFIQEQDFEQARKALQMFEVALPDMRGVYVLHDRTYVRKVCLRSSSSRIP